MPSVRQWRSSTQWRGTAEWQSIEQCLVIGPKYPEIVDGRLLVWEERCRLRTGQKVRELNNDRPEQRLLASDWPGGGRPRGQQSVDNLSQARCLSCSPSDTCQWVQWHLSYKASPAQPFPTAFCLSVSKKVRKYGLFWPKLKVRENINILIPLLLQTAYIIITERVTRATFVIMQS